jgi:RND family efflux transporter MFP subunit
MIVFLTVSYIILLLVLTRMKVVPSTSGTWLTIIPYLLILLIGFFIPMQWGAPGGDVRTLAFSVPITPNVAGEVIEVPVEPDTAVEKGDVLFKIDPTQYQAALDGLKAQLTLAETRLGQSKTLAASQAGSKYDVQTFQSQVDSLTARIESAEYNLRETVVRAPSDGLITYVGLRPGARVANVPLFKAMAFIDTSEPLLGAQIPQNFSQHIEPGQEAEVTFESRPGRIYRAKVLYVMPATAQGELRVTGTAAQAFSTAPDPFFVRLKLEDPEIEASLIPGSKGSVAIYTSKVEVAHVIRRVMIRLDAITNYIDPR